jgi:hypothetical protein
MHNVSGHENNFDNILHPVLSYSSPIKYYYQENVFLKMIRFFSTISFRTLPS